MKKFIIFLTIVYFGYVTTLVVFSSAKAPTKIFYGNFFPYLADKPISEDGFYMLTVAKNIAAGDGFVYNFHTKTSGVQPLSTILYSGVFYIGNIFGFNNINNLRFIIFFSALLLYCMAILLFKISNRLFEFTDKKLLFLLCILFSAFNFELLIYFTNGLETGIYSFLFLLSIYLSINIILKPDDQRRNLDLYLLGIFLGITSLARIDFLILSFGFLIITFLKKRLNLFEIIKIIVIQITILIPWVLLVYKVTGSIIQSSATVQTSWVNIDNLGERIFSLIGALMEHMTPLIFTMQRILLLIGIVLFVIFYLVFKKNNNPSFLFLPDSYRLLLLYWGTPFLVFVLIYFIYSSATYFYLRYTALIAVFFLPFFIYLLYDLFKKIKMKRQYMFLMFILMIFFIQANLYFHSGKLGVHQSLRVHFIKTNFSQDEKIAVFQSGVTGFFCENVINLDGKLNHIANNYRKENNIEKYIDSIGVNVLIEWRDVFPIGHNNYFFKCWKEKTNDIGDGRTACYLRVNEQTK